MTSDGGSSQNLQISHFTGTMNVIRFVNGGHLFISFSHCFRIPPRLFHFCDVIVLFHHVHCLSWIYFTAESQLSFTKNKLFGACALCEFGRIVYNSDIGYSEHIRSKSPGA